MAVTDAWADWSTTAASNSPAGAATPEVDDELRNIKAQVKANAWTVAVAATQAQQETGTATTVAVTPGVQKYHPSAAKAWAEIDSAAQKLATYNIGTVTDTGTGIVTIEYTVNFSGTAYAPVATVACQGAIRIPLTFTVASNNVVIKCYNTSFAAADPDAYCVACFGDQA